MAKSFNVMRSNRGLTLVELIFLIPFSLVLAWIVTFVWGYTGFAVPNFWIVSGVLFVFQVVAVIAKG